MTRYLLTLSIGPVQGFIAAARRTRDLWYGSFLLSDVARVVALYLQAEPGAQLVFPALDESMLQKESPADAPRIANRVTAVITTANIVGIVAQCRSHANDRLKFLGQRCLESLKSNKCEREIDEKLFLAQLEDVLEVYAAWAAFPDDPRQYKSTSDALDRLLAARKATRNFRAYIGAGGLPVSSLDGERESVLLPANKSPHLRARFRIDQAESLDSVGLIKRINGKGQAFPSIIRVALQPWLSTLNEADIKKLCTHFESLVKFDRASRYDGRNAGKDTKSFKLFPYDGELLLKTRIDAQLKQLRTATDAESAPEPQLEEKTLLELAAQLYPAEKNSSTRPPPEDGLYVAMLQADGDRMGVLLDHATNLDEHREISALLANFAREAVAIVDDYHGACIYSGGDDVLALLPLTEALACARKLADKFRETMTLMANKLNVKAGELPTLSVGVAFGHVLSPLSELRQNAQDAEKLAKQGHDRSGLRNALGIKIQPRGGAPVSSVGQWDESPVINNLEGFDRRLLFWREAFASGQLSQSTPYDLREPARELSGAALASEARRLISRRSEAGKEVATAIRKYLLDSHRLEPHAMLADELYVARWLNGQERKFIEPTAIKDVQEVVA